MNHHHPAKVRLAALALNNLGISSIQHRRNDEQAHKAFQDALSMLAAVVRAVMENTVNTILSPSIDTIMNKVSCAVIGITENNTCSSSYFQIVTIDEMAQTVQKLIQNGSSSTSLPIFIRMELEGATLVETYEFNEPTLETAVILYNFASAYQLQATTETKSTQQRSKYMKRAAGLFELALSVVDSNLTFDEIGINGFGLEPLAFSILALRGLVACSTTNHASSPCAQEKYIQQLSALQEEFMAHEDLITLFLDSSSRLAPAA